MENIEQLFYSMEYGPSLESDKVAQDWLNKKKNKLLLFINGEFVESESKKYFSNVNPANARKIIDVPQSNHKDLEKAIDAAQNGYQKWQQYSAFDQAKKLYALARHIQKHSCLFSVLESIDTGKPIGESKNIDIPLVIRHFYYHAGWIKLKESLFQAAQPLGIVGQIIPWNFPLLMLSWKIAPALAMGNAVILKPSENSPLTATLFAEICQQVNLPQGLVNILHGDGKIGELIALHPKVKKIAFTGSTEIGKHLRKITAGSKKKIALELGGKSPFIVCDNADLDSAIEGLVDSIWFNQGEVCCAGSKLLVQESIASLYFEKLKIRMQKLIVGHPLDKNTDIGAIINKKQLHKIEYLIEQGKNEGAEIWQPEIRLPKEGYYFPPTLCIADSSNILACEEIFGPVLTAMTFRSYNEAIQLANHSRYGLAASIWSDNINIALELAKKMQAGTVWINSTNQFDASSGFGGFKESGFGREGGIEGLWEYIDYKATESTNIKKIEKIKQTTIKQNKAGKSTLSSIDQTRKLFINGKQTRPDSGYSNTIYNAQQQLLGEVPIGNRKDLRHAVEAARGNKQWKNANVFFRSQILYYIAENMQQRKDDFIAKMQCYSNYTKEAAEQEVNQSIEQLFFWAGYADKNEGRIHQPPQNSLILSLPEPFEAIAIVCPNERPLYSFVYLMAATISMGNSIVIVPSEKEPLILFDLIQILETSDLPAGTVNIVNGNHKELAIELSKHDGINKLWYFGDLALQEKIESHSLNNIKQIWCGNDQIIAQTQSDIALSQLFVYHATQIKNIWIPFGF